MGKLFKNEVDIENGIVYKLDNSGVVGYIDKTGYIHCEVRDKFGNLYYNVHQVIFAEAHNLPKHLWPVDEHGEKFEIDHINTIRTDNRIENLRLVSSKENSNNPITKKNKSEANINNEKQSNKVYQYTLNGDLIKIWESTRECERNGYNHKSVGDYCNGKRKQKTYKGYIWSYIPL